MKDFERDRGSRSEKAGDIIRHLAPSLLFDLSLGGQTRNVGKDSFLPGYNELNPDRIYFYTPRLGDENVFVIDGEVLVTDMMIGQTRRYGTGDVFTLSKAVPTCWVVPSVVLRKYAIIQPQAPESYETD